LEFVEEDVDSLFFGGGKVGWALAAITRKKGGRVERGEEGRGVFGGFGGFTW